MRPYRAEENTSGGRTHGEPHPSWEDNVEKFDMWTSSFTWRPSEKIVKYVVEYAGTKREEYWDKKYNNQNIVTYIEFGFIFKDKKSYFHLFVHVDPAIFQKDLDKLKKILENHKIVGKTEYQQGAFS